MNEFLRLNKDLFSSKREFLTKLREVRQKFMNNITSNHNDTTKTTTNPTTNSNNNEKGLVANSSSNTQTNQA